MRILIVNTYYYPNMIGGAEQSVKLLAEGLRNRGNEVFVLSADKQNKDYEVINGVNIIRLDLANKNKTITQRTVRKISELNNLRMKKIIKSIIDEIKPEIIHTNNLFYISPIIWEIAYERKIKIVHTLRDYWGLCPKTSLLNSKAKICDKKNILCKFHTKNYEKFSKYVDVVTGPSNFILEIYNKNNLFNNIKKFMVPNAINFNVNSQLELIEKKKKIKSKTIQFLYIGSLHEHKGIEYLIRTFMNINNKNIILKICGNGPLRDFVEKSCKKDNRIIYLGSVFENKKDEVLRECDVMIIPSIWYEPFGRVVIEAYKYALPIIACEIGGIKELLDSKYSIAIKANSNEQLKLAIQMLSEREVLKKYIIDSSELLYKYNINEQISKFEEIYKLILK